MNAFIAAVCILSAGTLAALMLFTTLELRWLWRVIPII